MTFVCVNAYNDAALLDGCLRSIREHVPDPEIVVVDGRYASFRPDAPDNSADDTAAVADRFGARYVAAGPFRDEAAKHLYRASVTPADERVLWVDADERVLTFDPDCVADGVVGRVRIHNALMYQGGDVTYYPRWFRPEQLEDVPRVDRFSFDAPVRRTDRITFVHRADLRSDQYRDAKLRRFEREGRDPWYKSYLEALDERGHVGVEFDDCPRCGERSVTRSRVCGYDDEFSRVAACTARDRCWAAVEPYELDEYRYVPDPGRVREAFDSDPERVRAELMAAGNRIAHVVGPRRFGRYEPNAVRWLRDDCPRPLPAP